MSRSVQTTYPIRLPTPASGTRVSTTGGRCVRRSAGTTGVQRGAGQPLGDGPEGGHHGLPGMGRLVGALGGGRQVLDLAEVHGGDDPGFAPDAPAAAANE